MRKLLALSLALAVAACGDDGGGKKTDAGTGSDDSDIDAPATGGLVKLTVTSGGAGVAGVRVHFQRADSSLVTSVDTDASGLASADVPDGGFVTAVNPFGAPGGATAQLYTWASVKAGDELTLTEPASGGNTDVTFKAPIDTTGTVTDYYFSTPCTTGVAASAGNATSTTQVLSLDTRCKPMTDVVIASLDTNGEVVHWMFAADVSTSGAMADLSSMAITGTPMTKTLNWTNIPGAAGGIFYENGLYSSKGMVISWSGTFSGASATDMAKMTPFTNAIDVVTTYINAPYGEHLIVDWGAFSTSYSADITAREMKEATSGASWDQANHRITWTEAATGPAPDMANTETKTFRASASLYIYWSIIAPYTSGELKYPTLPVETVDYNAAASDVVEVYNGLQLIKVPGGYDAARERFYDVPGVTGFANATPGSALLQDIIEAGSPLRLKRTAGTPASRRKWAPAWKSRRTL